MGVYVSPTIVKNENGIVTEVREEAMPQSNPLYAINDLIFLDELKNSLLDIADKELDLSFFTKPNDFTYGNTANVNTSFSPEEVIKCLTIIRTAFQERENDFVRPYMYEGIYNAEGKQLRQAFIELQEGKLFWKKKIYKWGGLNAYENRATFQWYDDENQKWCIFR